jgi:hypothetical protein
MAVSGDSLQFFQPVKSHAIQQKFWNFIAGWRIKQA